MAPPTTGPDKSTLWQVFKKCDAHPLGHALLTPLGIADTLRDVELAYAEATDDDERRCAIERGNREIRRSVPAGLLAHVAIMSGIEHTITMLGSVPLLIVLIWYLIVRKLE